MATLRSRKDKILNFKGPVVATASPFDARGEVNGDAIGYYVSYLKANEAKGVYIHGTTGEGLSMTNQEKMALTRTWSNSIEKTAPGMLTIVNVSATCLKETQTHVELCQELGQIDGIALLPPFYYKPASVSDLVGYIKTVSSFGPDLPLVYYHIPSFTGVNVPLSDLVSSLLLFVPNFVGMKYTSPDIIEMQYLQSNFGGRIKIFAGFEETLLPATACGVEAAVCALFNFEPVIKLYREIVDHLESDIKRARNAQKLIADRNRAFQKGMKLPAKDVSDSFATFQATFSKTSKKN